MIKRKYVERRLLVVSKRRQSTDEGLTRFVAAMVLHQIERDAAQAAAAAPAAIPAIPDATEDSA